MSNINEILQKKMCSGCGACYSICPKGCIDIVDGINVNYPKIDLDKCLDCGMCMNVCPGKLKIDRLLSNKKVDIESNISDIKVLYSTDNDIRINSASGGAVTQVIKYLFEEKEIDGAIVVNQDLDNVLMNKAIVVDNIGDLIETQGSRYSPSSNCIPLREVIKKDGYKSLAFVGKPCEIEALSRIELNNRKLKDKIKIKIAIMCHHTPTREGLKNLLDSKNISIEKIDKIKFRGNGWPGKFEVKSKGKSIFSTSYFDAWNNYISKYSNEACNYCENPFPLEADIIVGDPWGDEYKDDNKGKSLLIIRGNSAKKLINKMEASNIFISESKGFGDVRRYQKYLMERYDRFYVLSLVFKKVHGYKISFKEYFKLVKSNPKNLLRYIKRADIRSKSYERWIYK